MSVDVSELNVGSLTASDKEDLRRFLENERTRAKFQATTHILTHACWKKCVPGPIKSSALDKKEEICLANCVDRFWELNLLTMRHLSRR